MRFLVVLKSITSGVSYHRLIVPLNRLKQKGYDIEFINTFKDKEIKESDYDYLVFNRSLGYGFKDVEIIEKFKNEGVKIILDIDDYWELPQHHPIVWRNDINYEEWKGSIMANISYADYIWTSTEELKQKIKGIAPTTPIIVSRNAIDYADPQWKSVRPKSKNKRDVVVGFETDAVARTHGHCIGYRDVACRLQIEFGETGDVGNLDRVSTGVRRIDKCNIGNAIHIAGRCRLHRGIQQYVLRIEQHPSAPAVFRGDINAAVEIEQLLA